MARRANADSQLRLFADSPPAGDDRSTGIQPAAVPPEQSDLARRMPAGIRLGTSSWSFPGWKGIVFEGTHSATRLAREGLAAYAAHPLLRAVGIDRTFYAPIPASAFRAYAEQVPADFRFLVKAPEACTLARFPFHPRYGAVRGESNPCFLDAEWARERILGPCQEGLGEKTGVVLFQFPPQDPASLGGPDGFPDRLFRFLAALPRSLPVAVELRNAELATPLFHEAVAAAGATVCLNAHPSMPEIARQAAEADRTAPKPSQRVIRWMLPRQATYEAAKERFAPFDRLLEPAPSTREQIAAVCREAVTHRGEALVIINNKAEGSAPLSAFALAAAITGPA